MAKANGSTSGSGADVSDEQWIVNQANFYRNSDLHAAKSWLIVGRTLFSRNFDIQVLSFVFVESGSQPFRSQANSLPGANRPLGRTLANSLPVLSLPGTFVPPSEIARELSFKGS